MTVDIDSLTPEARQHYRAIGERYSTAVVLAQADQTIQALSMYGHLLVDSGFGTGDGQRMIGARDQLLGKDGGVIQAKSDRKVLGKALSTARSEAKAERTSGLALLTGAEAQMLETDPETARIVQTALGDTRLAKSDKAIAGHLETMHKVLSLPALTEFVATRGGPPLLERLAAARNGLIMAKRNRSGKHVITAAAEHRNILDGIIVSLARSANAAARATARRLGQPAIAAAFKLDHLKSRRRRPAPVTETPEPGAPVTPEIPGSPEDPDQNPA